MTLLDRYIARVVITGGLVSIIVFSALFIFIDFIGELEYVGTHQYGATQALWYVMLSTPQRIYELSPSAILLGGLVSLGTLASHSELIAMRAAGITLTRFIRSVLQAGMVMACFVVIIGEFVVPNTTAAANALRSVALEKKVLAGGKAGFWAKDGNRYISVKQVLPNMQLNDIDIYQMNDERELVKSSHARSASYADGRWQLVDVRHSEFLSAEIRTSSSQVESWEKLLEPDLFDVLRLKPVNMSARNLYQYSDYMKANNLDASNYQLAFWMKVFTPLICLAMLMIAMPLVLSTSPRSGGIGYSIIIGLLLGIGFFVINRAINHIGIVYGLMPVLSAALPLMIVVGLSVFLLRRIN